MKRLILLSVFFFTSSALIRESLPTAKKTPRSFSPQLFQIINLGERSFLSTLIWSQAFILADTSRYEKDMTWLATRFLSISELTPWRFRNYLYGAQYLSVITDDDLGAEAVFSKGIHHFRKDPQLNFFGGTHALLELSFKQIARRRFFEASKNKNLGRAFPFLERLAQGLYLNLSEKKKLDRARTESRDQLINSQ